jgi:putative DNA primase/helicase
MEGKTEMTDENGSLLHYQPVNAPDVNSGVSWDDDRLTMVLEQQTEGNIQYFRNMWREYQTGIWDEREKEEIRRMIRVFLRTFRGRDGVKVSTAQVSAIESMMRDAIFVPDRTLNKIQKEQKMYIPLRNGIYNLQTWELEPHRKDLYFTYQLDFDYEPDADCPAFRRYLATSLVKPDGSPDPQLVDFTRSALAYSMTARTDLKASFWLLGKPDAGKSTFIAFIRELLGALHVSIDMEQMGKNQFMLSSLIGKRVATCTEAEAGAMISDGLYKAISGGSDAIWTDVKNKDGISFIPEVKLWWAMNNAPRTRDRSDAIFNRLLIIPFNRSVPKSERDPQLLQKLLDERAGIFIDLMFAYKRLVRAGGFEVPEQSKQTLEVYRLQNDTERTFFMECLNKDKNGRILSSELYGTYKEWCIENGFRPKQKNEVTQDFERLGLTRQRSTGGHWYWFGASFITAKKDIF